MNQELLNVLNNLEPISVVEIAIFGFAIAQVLMIILTVRRERDVKVLRELVEEQRRSLIELRAWVAGRNASRPPQIAPASKPTHEPTPSPEASKPETRAVEKDVARGEKAFKWQQDIAARLQSGVRAQLATTSAAESFKWFKDDPNEPRELVEARQAINGKTHHFPDINLPEVLATQPLAPQLEVERTLATTRLLKEDTDKARAIEPEGPKGLNGKW